MAYPVSISIIFSAKESRAYWRQTFFESLSLLISSFGRGITAKPSLSSFLCNFLDRLRFSSLHDPLKAPLTPSALQAVRSSRPALSVILTLGPKAGHLSIHMEQPFPYLMQLPIGPVDPVVSMNTSPSMTFPDESFTPRSCPSSFTTSVILVIKRISISSFFISLLTSGSTIITS